MTGGFARAYPTEVEGRASLGCPLGPEHGVRIRERVQASSRAYWIEDGSPFWILVALVLTLGMFWGYIEMFRGVFSKVGKGIIGRTESFLITMAGLAASRIFAAGGAGGLVLQAWALRQAGLPKRVVADKTISFLVLTYFPYAAAVIFCGVGLRLGVCPGEAPFPTTVRRQCACARQFPAHRWSASSSPPEIESPSSISASRASSARPAMGRSRSSSSTTTAATRRAGPISPGHRIGWCRRPGRSTFPPSTTPAHARRAVSTCCS